MAKVVALVLHQSKVTVLSMEASVRRVARASLRGLDRGIGDIGGIAIALFFKMAFSGVQGCLGVTYLL